jgi:glycine/D-amino acid oxidase-like deaminating enzyme/nitrite reductase/ring-hydroxylating ferredoxin subunit
MSSARTLPIWNAPDPFTRARFGRELPASVDVLVVGAGIAGLTTACCLAREGRGVCVIDREGLGGGETIRSTAHLASALDDRFYNLARWHGAEGARLAADSHATAIDWIEHFVDAQHDRCGFRRVPGYLFSFDGNTDRLERELEAARDAGLGVSFERSGIPGLSLGPALRFERQGRIDVGRYLLALAEACAMLGVRFVLSAVSDVQGGDPATVTVSSGQRVQAAAVVVASNVPFHERFAVHTKQAAYRTYVVAGEIESGAMPDALLWDDGDPYHYVRLAECEGGLRVIVGGEDHKTGQDDDTQAFVRLQEWARQRIPGIGTFTHGWSGQIIEPADGLAFLGADAGGEDNVYIVTGDSGNGVTHGTIGGLLIADLVAGRDNPWTGLYDPSRKLVRAPGGWTRENANVALQYRDWFGGSDDVDGLARGEGTVVRRGVHQVALYRDGEGGLTAFSARCPHMGCVVRWSPQEKSWDCPCHGSRFDGRTGAILNGPASAPLDPVDWPR